MSPSTNRAAELGAALVANLTERGVLSDPRVANALGTVRRHVFLPETDLDSAYADQAVVTRWRDGVPVSSASQPAIVAIMLQQLCPREGSSVLEIGAGTGYNAALLSELVGPGGRVVTIDIDPEVVADASTHLETAGITNVTVICADGALGWPKGAPYDGIIVTAGASDLAPAWLGQLAPDGRLVVPLSIRGVQHSVAWTRADGYLRSVSVSDCGFMPMQGQMANADLRLAVPGHAGVYVQAAPGVPVNPESIARALNASSQATPAQISATAREVFGSLRRWLAFGDPAAAMLTYVGTAEAAGASGVPAVLQYSVGSRVERSSPCILGPAGLAVLDLDVPAGEAEPHTALRLALRGYGQADQECGRLRKLLAAWDTAGRPATARLRIDAYPEGSERPLAAGEVTAARHTTFIVTTT